MIKKIHVAIVVFITALMLFILFFLGLLFFSEIQNCASLKELKKIDYDCENLRDPAYHEMKEFLARDKTDFKEYSLNILNRYVCTNFANDVKRGAIKEGIRCAGVIIWLEGRGTHAMVAFRTIDKGIIFIEPGTDEEVEVGEGVRYHLSYINEGIVFYVYATITRFEVYWPEFKK